MTIATQAKTMSSNESVPSAAERTVRYEHSSDLAGLLAQIESSLIVSTYQAGKLVVVGAMDEKLQLTFHNFDRPMGVAVDQQGSRMSVAARDKVWHLQNVPSIAERLEPAGAFEKLYLTRSASITGNIQAHEMSWCDDELWIVNTLFSCLCTLDDSHSFVPRWRPKFVTELAAEDRCHLNGLACLNGRPKFVTVMAESDEAGGWRPNKATTGSLIDVERNETIATGFAMPHSPRIHEGNVFLLDSGRGGLVRIDANGKAETVARFPGYTRGLAIRGSHAFVGLSKIRETSTFGGVPIAKNREHLKCGVAVLDLTSGELVGQFEFQTGVSEIFDITLLPSCGVCVHGPFSTEDGTNPIWVVPNANSTF